MFPYMCPSHLRAAPTSAQPEGRAARRAPEKTPPPSRFGDHPRGPGPSSPSCARERPLGAFHLWTPVQKSTTWRAKRRFLRPTWHTFWAKCPFLDAPTATWRAKRPFLDAPTTTWRAKRPFLDAPTATWRAKRCSRSPRRPAWPKTLYSWPPGRGMGRSCASKQSRAVPLNS
jgi:hypothetical protein